MFGFVVSDQVFQIRFWLAPFMTCETSERRKAGSGLRRENWFFSKSINTNTLNSSNSSKQWFYGILKFVMIYFWGYSRNFYLEVLRQKIKNANPQCNHYTTKAFLRFNNNNKCKCTQKNKINFLKVSPWKLRNVLRKVANEANRKIYRRQAKRSRKEK